MPHYFKLGEIPKKRHIQFRKPDGNLYAEELFSTEGFNSYYTLMYHCHPPTMIQQQEAPYDVTPKVIEDRQLKHRSLLGFDVPAEADYLASRKVILCNNDIQVAVAAPQQSMKDYFYKNADADEIIFCHVGSGVVRTQYGKVPFKYGDYIVIPRGTIYQIQFDTADNRLLITESYSPVEFPRRYMSRFGQLHEHAPFCERDIHPPTELETFDERGDYKILIKKQNKMYPFHYSFHPFDVIGWDGQNYPYTFSIHDFEPITGRVHQPPPVHQTFEGHNFVICSFVPRLYDYHPLAIPAPYHHSNIDSDEVLYYVDGDFMSRNNVKKGQFTLHPGGIAHGPHPGTVEKSIGKKETLELAVMIDTFKPLLMTEEALKIEDPDYYLSWLDDKGRDYMTGITS